VDNGIYAIEVYHFFEALKKFNLWPLSRRLQRSTLQEVLDDLQQFSACRGTKKCRCDNRNFENRIETAAFRVGRELKGLCLTCFKKGKATWEEGNCSSGKCNIHPVRSIG